MNRINRRRRSALQKEIAFPILWSAVDDATKKHVLSGLALHSQIPFAVEETLLRYRDQHADDAYVAANTSEQIAFRLRSLPPDSFSMRLLDTSSPFVESHELLSHESEFGLTTLFDTIRRRIEDFNPSRESIGKGFKKQFQRAMRIGHGRRWWRKFLKSLPTMPKSDASIIALLLAYELRVRGRTITDLTEMMRAFRLGNPQAALFLLDLKAAVKSQPYTTQNHWHSGGNPKSGSTLKFQ